MGSLETIIETKNLRLKYQQILLLSRNKKNSFFNISRYGIETTSLALCTWKRSIYKKKSKQTHLDGTVACSLDYLTVVGLRSVKLSNNNVLMKKYITS